MIAYGDTIKVAGLDRAIVPQIVERITDIGHVLAVREYDDHTEVVFLLEAETEWDACALAYEVECHVAGWGIAYEPDRARLLTGAEAVPA